MPFFRRKQQHGPGLPIGIDDVNAILGQAANTYGEAVWIPTFQAWIVGGSIAANDSLREIPELRDRWHGTERQILGVLKVFSAAMASHWARVVWTAKMTVADKQRNIENGLTHIVDFFGGEIDVEAAGFLALDRQINADLDYIESGQGMRVVANELLFSLAARELSRPLPVELGILTLPVDSTRDLAERGWDYLCTSPQSVVTGPVIVSEAASKMFDWYKELARSRER